MANIAMEIGRPIVYDPQKRLAVGDHEATKRFRREYRKGWKYPSAA
jgi:hypothetical protein